MKHGKTAVYTILKNELKFIDTWLYYAEPFDYKVLLDTGSTDGSWELLQERATTDKKLIIEQKIFTPWRFDVARNHNLSMIPNDVVWCLSPDLDEYFSINTHDEMEKIIDGVPAITNISCDRLDIYSRTVRVGPPKLLPTNKIHKKNDYIWKQPIYEHLSWKHVGTNECELYSDEIFLIHNQDFKKKERQELYVKMLEEEYQSNSQNTWCLWFLIYYYKQSRQLNKFLPAACDFVTYYDKSKRNNDWFKTTINDLKEILNTKDLLDQQSYNSVKSTLLKVLID